MQALGRVLRDLGGRKLRQLRFPNHSRPMCWAVRRADTYAALSEKALTLRFTQQDVNRGHGLRIVGTDAAAEDRG